MRFLYAVFSLILISYLFLSSGAQQVGKPALQSAAAADEKNENIEKLADKFLKEAPRNNADALLKYQALFEKIEQNVDYRKVYCRAAEKDPHQTLEIIDVYFGGAADGRLPLCHSLQLDKKIPSVNDWLHTLKGHSSPREGGTIISSLNRTDNLALLAAAIAPDYIPLESKNLPNAEKAKTDNAFLREKESHARRDIINFYQEEFGYPASKAEVLADKNMKVIAWRISR